MVEQKYRSVSSQLQKKEMQVLALQEKEAQAHKEVLKAQQEKAELAGTKEELGRELALKDQQMAAAIAQRERELLLEAGAPAATAIPRSAAGPGPHVQQAMEVVEKLTNLGAEIKQAGNCNLQLLIEALAQLAPALAALGMPASRAAAPSPPPLGGSLPPTPQQELNEVTMVEGKRKPEGAAEELDDGEASAAASLFGDATSAAQKGGVERKKTKTSDQELCPSLAKTIADAEAVRRLVNKNLRGVEGSASSSTEQQLG